MSDETERVGEESQENRNEEPQEIQGSEEIGVCPHCGRSLSEVPDKVDPEEVKEYFRCVLGNKRFKKTYTYLDDKILITLKETTMNTSDTLIEVLRTKVDDPDLLVDAFRAKFMLTCCGLVVDGETLIDALPKDGEWKYELLVDSYKDVVGDKSMALDRICDDALARFNRLLECGLREAVTDTDF